MDAVKVMDEIRTRGTTTADDSPREIGALSQGDFTAQGDVIFWPLDSLPKGVVEIESPQSQLAPGTTKGSRHCVRSSDMAGCVFYRLKNPNALQGPVIESETGFTVEHPEHGNQSFPAGIWFVTYQRQHADELRRIAD